MSATLRASTTASGNSGAIHVVVWVCCSRWACDVKKSRLKRVASVSNALLKVCGESRDDAVVVKAYVSQEDVSHDRRKRKPAGHAVRPVHHSTLVYAATSELYGRASTAHQADKRRDREQHDGDEEHDLGDFNRRTRDAAEAQKARHQRDDEKRHNPTQHGSLLVSDRSHRSSAKTIRGGPGSSGREWAAASSKCWISGEQITWKLPGSCRPILLYEGTRTAYI